MKIILFLIVMLSSHLTYSSTLAVNWKSDLNFGTVYAGSGPIIVPAGGSENGENASFSITGDANTSFSVILPSSVTMSLNGEGVHNITISNFTSNISGTGVLSLSGESTVYVGGTINAIPVNLPPGQYRESVTIEVIY